MDALIKEFHNLAIKRWEYMDADDSTNSNIYADKLSNQAKLLKEAGILLELESLLTDSNEGVKFESACALLETNSKKAIEALTEMTQRKGIIPFIAKQTLKHWNKKTGKLLY